MRLRLGQLYDLYLTIQDRYSYDDPGISRIILIFKIRSGLKSDGRAQIRAEK